MKKSVFFLLLIFINNNCIAQASFFDDSTKLYGMIDKSGKIILEPTYKYISLITDHSCVFFNGEKYGLLNEFGKIILQPVFSDECSLYDSEFSEGLINIVKRNFLNADSISWEEERAYCDEKGKIVIDFMDIEYAGKFCNGKAIIGKYTEDPNYDFKYNLINNKGLLLLENWEHDFSKLKSYINCFNERDDSVFTLRKQSLNDGFFVYSDEHFRILTSLENISYAIYYHSLFDRALIYSTDNKLFLLNGKGVIIKEISEGIDLNGKKWNGGFQFFSEGFIQVRAMNEAYDTIEFLLDLNGNIIKQMNEEAPGFRNDCNYGSH